MVRIFSSENIKLNNRTQFYPLCRIFTVHRFIASKHTLGLSVKFFNFREGFFTA